MWAVWHFQARFIREDLKGKNKRERARVVPVGGAADTSRRDVQIPAKAFIRVVLIILYIH